MCSGGTISLDDLIMELILLLWLLYVGDSEKCFLKSLWQFIPYIVATRVMFRAIEVDYIMRDFRLLRELKWLGFLYLLGYCFQSYL